MKTTRPPMNVTISKGSVHVAVQRGFVDFALHKAQSFVEWLEDTRIPDETFFASLNNSPQLGIPGAYTGIYRFSCFARSTLNVRVYCVKH